VNGEVLVNAMHIATVFINDDTQGPTLFYYKGVYANYQSSA
jgi:hypothetical protein